MNTLIEDALATARLVRLARSRARQAGELLDCPWCLAIWTGLGVVVARRAAPRAWQPVARVLAVAMIAGAIADRA